MLAHMRQDAICRHHIHKLSNDTEDQSPGNPTQWNHLGEDGCGASLPFLWVLDRWLGFGEHVFLHPKRRLVMGCPATKHGSPAPASQA